MLNDKYMIKTLNEMKKRKACRVDAEWMVFYKDLSDALKDISEIAKNTQLLIEVLKIERIDFFAYKLEIIVKGKEK